MELKSGMGKVCYVTSLSEQLPYKSKNSYLKVNQVIGFMVSTV